MGPRKLSRYLDSNRDCFTSGCGSVDGTNTSLKSLDSNISDYAERDLSTPEQSEDDNKLQWKYKEDNKDDSLKIMKSSGKNQTFNQQNDCDVDNKFVAEKNVRNKLHHKNCDNTQSSHQCNKTVAEVRSKEARLTDIFHNQTIEELFHNVQGLCFEERTHVKMTSNKEFQDAKKMCKNNWNEKCRALHDAKLLKGEISAIPDKENSDNGKSDVTIVNYKDNSKACLKTKIDTEVFERRERSSAKTAENVSCTSVKLGIIDKDYPDNRGVYVESEIDSRMDREDGLAVQETIGSCGTSVKELCAEVDHPEKGSLDSLGFSVDNEDEEETAVLELKMPSSAMPLNVSKVQLNDENLDITSGKTNEAIVSIDAAEKDIETEKDQSAKEIEYSKMVSVVDDYEMETYVSSAADLEIFEDPEAPLAAQFSETREIVRGMVIDLEYQSDMRSYSDKDVKVEDGLRKSNFVNPVAEDTYALKDLFDEDDCEQLEYNWETEDRKENIKTRPFGTQSLDNSCVNRRINTYKRFTSLPSDKTSKTTPAFKCTKSLKANCKVSSRHSKLATAQMDQYLHCDYEELKLSSDSFHLDVFLHSRLPSISEKQVWDGNHRGIAYFGWDNWDDRNNWNWWDMGSQKSELIDRGLNPTFDLQNSCLKYVLKKFLHEGKNWPQGNKRTESRRPNNFPNSWAHPCGRQSSQHGEGSGGRSDSTPSENSSTGGGRSGDNGRGGSGTERGHTGRNSKGSPNDNGDGRREKNDSDPTDNNEGDRATAMVKERRKRNSRGGTPDGETDGSLYRGSLATPTDTPVDNGYMETFSPGEVARWDTSNHRCMLSGWNFIHLMGLLTPDRIADGRYKPYLKELTNCLSQIIKLFCSTRATSAHTYFQFETDIVIENLLEQANCALQHCASADAAGTSEVVAGNACAAAIKSEFQAVQDSATCILLYRLLNHFIYCSTECTLCESCATVWFLLCEHHSDTPQPHVSCGVDTVITFCWCLLLEKTTVPGGLSSDLGSENLFRKRLKQCIKHLGWGLHATAVDKLHQGDTSKTYIKVIQQNSNLTLKKELQGHDKGQDDDKDVDETEVTLKKQHSKNKPPGGSAASDTAGVIATTFNTAFSATASYSDTTTTAAAVNAAATENSNSALNVDANSRTSRSTSSTSATADNITTAATITAATSKVAAYRTASIASPEMDSFRSMLSLFGPGQPVLNRTTNLFSVPDVMRGIRRGFVYYSSYEAVQSFAREIGVVASERRRSGTQRMEASQLNSLHGKGFILREYNNRLLIGNQCHYEENEEWFTSGASENDVIGMGAFGRCFACVNPTTEFTFCTKKIPLDKFEANEIIVWLKLEHPDIVQFYGLVVYNDVVYIFQELLTGETLDKFIERERALNSHMALDFFAQLLSVLAYLHSKQLIHDDIKADNIFVRNHRIVLIDFGLSSPAARVPEGSQPVGAQTHWSPEKAGCRGYDHGSDVWAAASVLVHMVAGFQPWHCHVVNNDLQTLMYKIGCLTEPPIDHVPSLPPPIMALITRAWTIDPDQRPTAAELLLDPAFHLLDTHLASDEIFTAHLRSTPAQPRQQQLDQQRQQQEEMPSLVVTDVQVAGLARSEDEAENLISVGQNHFRSLKIQHQQHQQLMSITQQSPQLGSIMKDFESENLWHLKSMESISQQSQQLQQSVHQQHLLESVSRQQQVESVFLQELMSVKNPQQDLESVNQWQHGSVSQRKLDSGSLQRELESIRQQRPLESLIHDPHLKSIIEQQQTQGLLDQQQNARIEAQIAQLLAAAEQRLHTTDATQRTDSNMLPIPVILQSIDTVNISTTGDNSQRSVGIFLEGSSASNRNEGNFGDVTIVRDVSCNSDDFVEQKDGYRIVDVGMIREKQNYEILPLFVEGLCISSGEEKLGFPKIPAFVDQYTVSSDEEVDQKGVGNAREQISREISTSLETRRKKKTGSDNDNNNASQIDDINISNGGFVLGAQRRGKHSQSGGSNIDSERETKIVLMKKNYDIYQKKSQTEEDSDTDEDNPKNSCSSARCRDPVSRKSPPSDDEDDYGNIMRKFSDLVVPMTKDTSGAMGASPPGGGGGRGQSKEDEGEYQLTSEESADQVDCMTSGAGFGNVHRSSYNTLTQPTSLGTTIMFHVNNQVVITLHTPDMSQRNWTELLEYAGQRLYVESPTISMFTAQFQAEGTCRRDGCCLSCHATNPDENFNPVNQNLGAAAANVEGDTFGTHLAAEIGDAYARREAEILESGRRLNAIDLNRPVPCHPVINIYVREVTDVEDVDWKVVTGDSPRVVRRPTAGGIFYPSF